MWAGIYVNFWSQLVAGSSITRWQASDTSSAITRRQMGEGRGREEEKRKRKGRKSCEARSLLHFDPQWTKKNRIPQVNCPLHDPRGKVTWQSAANEKIDRNTSVEKAFYCVGHVYEFKRKKTKRVPHFGNANRDNVTFFIRNEKCSLLPRLKDVGWKTCGFASGMNWVILTFNLLYRIQDILWLQTLGFIR